MPLIAKELFREVRAFCLAQADDARVRRYAHYFREGYDAYGVDDKDPAWCALRHLQLGSHGFLGRSGEPLRH